MFKIKRPAIIGLLLVLLVFTGYLNFQLTQQALLKASKDYNDYEVGEMEIIDDTEVAGVGNIDEVDKDYISIVDSMLPNEENIAAVVSSGNSTIKDAMEADISKANRNYFVEYRLSRDKLRANLVDRLGEIVNNTNTTETVRTEAQQEIIKLGNISEKELEVEGLIKSKGFTEALTFMTDKNIKVVVDIKELSEQDMVKILDIVKSETNFDMNNIKIMKKQ